MSRIHIYALSLCVIAFTAACASTPEPTKQSGRPENGARETFDAPEGPKPETTLERPDEPTLKPVEADLAQPEAFRFDARKKVALQKRKPDNPVRRPPTDTLPEPPGRQAPLSLTSSQLHHPLPPPKAPEITPVIPEDARASSEATSASLAQERQAAANSQVPAQGPSETPQERRRGEMSPAAARGTAAPAPDTAAASAPASGRAPAAGSGTASSRAPAAAAAPAQATAPSDSGPTAEAPDETGATERQRRDATEPAQGTASSESPVSADAPGRSGTPDDGPGESYPYELVESSDRTESVVGEELTVRLPGDGWL